MNLSEILSPENCCTLDQIASWEEAIEISCEPLIRGGYCTEEYVAAIFENTRKNGFYYIVCENLAIIHATSKVGVNRSQMAITTLKEPVIFGENTYPVRVLAALAAVDSDSHLAAMQALATVFMDTELTKQLLDATSGEQIYQLLADQES